MLSMTIEVIKLKPMKKMNLVSILACLLIIVNTGSYSQNVGINTSGSAPDPSALLDIDATGLTPKKGVLIPRVALASTSDGVTISNPATSLLVYNTGTGLSSAGYYYNSGTSGSPVWVQLITPVSSNPLGSFFTFAGTTPPTGYLECDGSAVSRTTYANLFAVIGTMYGVGNGTTTFNLPDMRGTFMRGWAHGSANDPDRASRTNRGDGTTGDNVGTKQTSQYTSHTHGFGTLTGTTDAQGAHTHGPGTFAGVTDAQGTHTHGPGTLSGVTNVTGAHTHDDYGANWQVGMLGFDAWIGLGIAVPGTSAGAHSHSVTLNAGATASSGSHTHSATLNSGVSASSGSHTHSVTLNAGASGANGGNETRPININLLYCIKY